jgi:hypothetical protein
VYKILGGKIVSGKDKNGCRWIFNKLPSGNFFCACSDNFDMPKIIKPAKLSNNRFEVFYKRFLNLSN